jgi:thioester reductase-like protein
MIDVTHIECLRFNSNRCAFFPYYSQPDASMWEWFIIPTDLMGVEWRPAGENVYEQVIKRKDNSKHRGLQSCFYTFPELDEFSTKDLYQPHPALKDHWKYMGRADDIIVFSTGEKLNPVTIEMAVMGHPEVIGAQVVGSKQFHAALIVEPAQHPKSEEEKKVLLDDVWPTIEAVNSETVAHGRVPRDYVFLTDPKRPFPRAGKGTIQRAMAAKLYAHDIKSFFEQRKDEMAISMDLDVTSQPAFARSLQQLVQSVFKGDELGANDDFFTAGMDSLQAIQLSRTLRASFETAGIELGEKEIDSRTIYNYPSVTKLANHTLTLAHANLGEIKPGQNPSSDITVDEKVMFDALVKKYIRDLPAATPNKPVAAQKGQVIIITGTTGALGSYLLDLALKCPHVGKVICFNRGADSRERQIKITSARGLSTDFSRAEFLQADLAEPDLGLAPEVKHRLSDEIDRVIHNAWPVNFNMSVGSFELQIRGVRHLVDFSAKVAKKAVPITFISTAGTVERWPTPEVPVPEKSLPDWSLAMLGYGQSKLASSMILDKATRESGVPSVIVRVGQIAGPRANKGQWNPQEWLPSLVRSSLYLGLLPDSLGSFENVGWAPVEDIANMVLDISGVTFPRPAEEVNGYFHALNPKPTDWSSLIPTLRDFYGERIQKVVSLEEWICALEQSQVDSLSIDINPAVKLLDTYRLAAEGVKIGTKGISMSTTRTELYSLAIRQAEAVSPALMRHWCEQWQF